MEKWTKVFAKTGLSPLSRISYWWKNSAKIKFHAKFIRTCVCVLDSAKVEKVYTTHLAPEFNVGENVIMH